MTSEFGQSPSINDFLRSGEQVIVSWKELGEQPLVPIEMTIQEILVIVKEKGCWVRSTSKEDSHRRLIAIGRQREGITVPVVLVFGLPEEESGKESAWVLEEQVQMLHDLCSGNGNDVIDGLRSMTNKLTKGEIRVMGERLLRLTRT